jgi:hypothetical protein
MSISTDQMYIGHYVLRQIGVGTYTHVDVSSGETELRVMNPDLFEPAGGSFLIENTDNLVTYTAIQQDRLTGIPASGTGSIAATISSFNQSTPSLIYVPNLITGDEVEEHLERYRKRLFVRCDADVDKKVYRARRGWFDTSAELRDNNDSGGSALSPDTSDYHEGSFTFSTARSETHLYLFGYAYDPFLAIADILESLIHDERWARYFAVGQIVKAGRDANEIAEVFRSRSKRIFGGQ